MSNQAAIHHFPLPGPLGPLSRLLGLAEDDIVRCLDNSRGGGPRTLAAMAVPAREVERIARMVADYPEVEIEGRRSHPYNLWFVVRASNSERVRQVLNEIAAHTGLGVLHLPLEAAARLDHH